MGATPDEPPYWHGHSWQPTGVTWDPAAGQFSDGSPPTGPGGGPWRGPVIGPPNSGDPHAPGGGAGDPHNPSPGFGDPDKEE